MNRNNTGAPVVRSTQELPTTDPRLYAAALNGLSHALALLTAPGELTAYQLRRAVGKATRAATAIKRMTEGQP